MVSVSKFVLKVVRRDIGYDDISNRYINNIILYKVIVGSYCKYSISTIYSIPVVIS